MGIAQNLKATHTVGENVRGVVDKVAAIDSKVAGVDERVAGVDDRVAGVGDRVASIDNTMKGVDAMVSSVDDRVRVVDDRVVEAIRGAYIIFNRSPKPYLYLIHSDGKEVKAATQQTASDVDQIKRLSSNLAGADYGALRIFSGNQLRENIHKWLSPPDPSTNHNIACSTHHKKTAAWFFQGSIFQEWKSTGSLLWINGKRLPRPFSNLTPSNAIFYCSWLGQKCSMVRGFVIVPVRDDRPPLSVPQLSRI